MKNFYYIFNDVKIFVQVKASVKKESVKKTNESHFVVAVSAPAREGKANEAVAKALAEYLKIGAWRIQLVSGFSSKSKVFEIA